MTNSLTMSEFLANSGMKFTPEQLEAIAEYENSQRFATVVGSIKKWRDESDRSDIDLTPTEFLSRVWELSGTLTAMVTPNAELSRGKVQTQIGFELDGRTVQVRVYETPEA